MRGHERSEAELIRQFWANVATTADPAECWLWTAGTIGNKIPGFRYGSIWWRGKNLLAHRLSWELHNGTPPPGDMQVCHHCDTPLCVNPAHLFIGTNLDNMADKCAKGRQVRGARHGLAKLTDEAVREIRARWRAGASQTALAREYGVSGTLVFNVVRGRVWRHVEDAVPA